jgi:hypothetical protein
VVQEELSQRKLTTRSSNVRASSFVPTKSFPGTISVPPQAIVVPAARAIAGSSADGLAIQMSARVAHSDAIGVVGVKAEAEPTVRFLQCPRTDVSRCRLAGLAAYALLLVTIEQSTVDISECFGRFWCKIIVESAALLKAPCASDALHQPYSSTSPVVSRARHFHRTAVGLCSLPCNNQVEQPNGAIHAHEIDRELSTPPRESCKQRKLQSCNK